MIVSAWKIGTPNIKTGSGYGIRIKLKDRDRYFSRDWSSVRIRIENGREFDANISKAFWEKCPELRSKWIGRWLLEQGLIFWPISKPPKLRLDKIGDRIFKLRGAGHKV